MVPRAGGAASEDIEEMNKKISTEKPRLSLRKATLKNLSAVRGGQMNLNPRTDCICCKACATAAC
jgi:hypothetical protein